MKKKLLTKSLSIFLCAAMTFSTLPVSATGLESHSGSDDADWKIQKEVTAREVTEETAEVTAKETTKETAEVSTEETTKEEAEEVLTSQVISIFDLDWRMATDEEIDHILGNTEWEDIGNWLNSMTEEELKELLKRDTVLNKETSIEECSVEESLNGEDEVTLVPQNSKTMVYYKYALERAEKSMMTRAVFKSSSGYYQIMFVKGSETCIFQTKLSGLDKETGSSVGQKATISVTKKSGNNFVNFWQNAGQYNTTGGTTTYTLKQHDGSSGYYMINSRLGFTKPAGYTATYQKVLASNTNTVNPNSAECKLYFYDNGNWDTSKKQYSNSNSALANEVLVTHLNVLEHAGLGTGSSVVNNCFKIVLTPIAYKVAYNGNGATGGGVSPQTCAYGTSYNYQPNGFTRQYTVTYDGNGGQPGVASHTVQYGFKGWSTNQAATSGVAAGTIFSNATQTNGATIQLYAIWQAASVQLPTAARVGYQFSGWSTSQGVKNASIAYVPTKNETVKANWKANTYQVKYYDGFTNEVKGTQTMCYDVKAGLQSFSSLGISKPGYTFKGWSSNGGVYADGEQVLNLTTINNDTVTLTATWSANKDTPYIVRRYVQKESGNTNLNTGYEVYTGKEVQGEEIFYGESDSTVTVPATAISGYITPDAQMVKIAADGSTIVNFYYNIEKESKIVTGGNSYTNNYGMNQLEVQELMSALNKGSDASLTIDGIKYTIVKNADGTLSIKLADMGKTEIVTIPNEIYLGGKTYAITEIQKECFKNNSIIKEVTVGSNISSIGESAFEGCTSLKQITLNKGLTSIGDLAFKGCTSLATIKTPETLQSIGDSAFMNCTGLKTVTLNEGLLSIGSKAFYNCKVLTKINIPKSVLKIGNYGFGKCVKLKTLTFAADSSLITVGTGVFSNCTALTKVKLPTKLTKISTKAFYNCKSLKSITLGTGVTRIGNRAFENCKVLSSIVVPKRVQTIGVKAFYNCNKLKKVTIKSKGLTAVGSKAFKKCKKGIKFKYPNSKKEFYEKLLKSKY